VTESHSGEDAVGKLRGAEPFALLITDFMMPGMTGTDVAAVAAHLRPNVPVLVITGFADAAGLPQHLERLTKPFRIGELADRVAGLLAHAPA
jgi:CheY-like chemotaxis protein